ncbi:MAG: MraY family glycosyltransferase [Bacillota bacterium]
MAFYWLVFLTGLVTTLVATPAVRALALKFGIVDRPGERRVHSSPIPLLGGIAICLGFILSVLLFCDVGSPVVGLLVGGVFILAVGVVDDVLDLKPWQKLMCQIAAALVLVLFGGKIEFLTNPFGGMVYLSYLSIPLTVLWIVALTNVVNFMDGIDGVCAGISAITCLTVFSVAWLNDQPYVAPLALALAGAALGFLRYNLHPATIFMGDAGAMFLGYTIAGISVIGAVKGATTFALSIPAVALGLPIMDTAFVIAGRIGRGSPFYKPDNRHMHHRLLSRGFDQRQAAAFMFRISILLAVSALILSRHDILTMAVAAVVASVAVVQAVMTVRSGDATAHRETRPL